jgi:hypothetical protein
MGHLSTLVTYATQPGVYLAWLCAVMSFLACVGMVRVRLREPKVGDPIRSDRIRLNYFNSIILREMGICVLALFFLLSPDGPVAVECRLPFLFWTAFSAADLFFAAQTRIDEGRHQ